MLRNLPITEARCAGTDHKRTPTICPQRNHCQRHRQVELDRQLQLPAEVLSTMKTMGLPRVGVHECHYLQAL
jgi:hypothetical protein